MYGLVLQQSTPYRESKGRKDGGGEERREEKERKKENREGNREGQRRRGGIIR